MSSAFDVPKAVDKRVSTMAVDDLAKRGMRTVKVLDKAAIMSPVSYTHLTLPTISSV